MNSPISPISPTGHSYPIKRIQPINKDRQPTKERQRQDPPDVEPDVESDRDESKPTIDEKV